MWRILYFTQLPGQYLLFEYFFMFKQIVPASLNIALLKAGDEH